MKIRILIVLVTLTSLVGCKTQTATYPDSISGGYVFTYDDEIRSTAFELATIYTDSGYLSLIHVDAIEHYSELLSKKEWEADNLTIHLVVCAYQIVGKKIPHELNEFVEPDYIENNQNGIEQMRSQIDQRLEKLSRLDQGGVINSESLRSST